MKCKKTIILSFILLLTLFCCFPLVNAYERRDYYSPTNVITTNIDSLNGGGTTTSSYFKLRNSYNQIDYYDEIPFLTCTIVSSKPLLSLSSIVYYQGNNIRKTISINQTFSYDDYETFNQPSFNREIEALFIDGDDYHTRAWAVYLGSYHEGQNIYYITSLYCSSDISDFQPTSYEIRFDNLDNTDISYYLSNYDYWLNYSDFDFILLNYKSYLVSKSTYIKKSSVDNLINEAENRGYNRGLNDAIDYNQNGSFYSLFDSLASVPLHTFGGLFDFEILGVNMKGFVISLLAIALGCLVIKLIIKLIS